MFQIHLHEYIHTQPILTKINFTHQIIWRQCLSPQTKHTHD